MANPAPAPPVTTEIPTTWGMRALMLCTGLLFAFSHPVVWPGDVSDVANALSRPAWVLAFVCLVPSLWAVRKLSPWRAYLLSAWGFVPGVFIMLYWLMIAMHVFGGIPKVVSAILLSMLGVAGWNLMGTAVGVARWIEVHWRFPSWIAVPIGWVGMEMWRARVYFGGFPWGNLGSTPFNNLTLLQLGSLAGVYGIILLIVSVNVALFEVVRFLHKERTFPTTMLGANALALVLAVAYGQYRIAVVDAEARGADKLKVGLLQGNIEQGIKNKDGQHREFIIQRYAALQKDALQQGADVVVWPEASYPVPQRRDQDKALDFSKFPSLGSAAGIVGATVFWPETPELSGDMCRVPKPPAGCRGRMLQHNSALVASSDGTYVGRFDKSHLVPFGEYVPWPLGPVVKAIVPLMGTQVPGDKLVPVTLPHSRVQPQVATLICYEGVFPQHTRDFVANGAELLFNVTNDAWYGISSASVQHLAFYTSRAAEHGRAVGRVANTGITAGIDPVGRILQPSTLYETTAVVVELPIMKGTTLYALTGDLLGWVFALTFLCALGLGIKGWYVARRERRASTAK